MKGASAIEAGVLVSVPLVLAVFLQWLLIKKFQNLTVSSWVPGMALVQFFALVLLAFGSVTPAGGVFIILLIIYSVYWFGHFASQPAWNRWIFDLISVEKSQFYFSLRMRVMQTGILTGLILGGYALHLNILNLPIQILFLSIFLLAAILKFFSYSMLKQQGFVETKIKLDIIHAKNLFLKYKPFLKSFSLFNVSVFLSASYVVSYLLVDRGLSYEQFMWVMAGLFLGKILMTLITGRLEENIQPFKLLFYGGLVAAPLPMLWPLCSHVWMLFTVHIISGLAWGAWEVGLSLCFFKNLHHTEKMEMISIYNLVGILTQVTGTLIGAFVLKFLITENYNLLFVISGTVRLVCVFSLRKKTFGEIAA